MRGRSVHGAAIALMLALALLISGCGAGTTREDPRRALVGLLNDLASGDRQALCAGLTSGAIRQLALEFGGGSCPSTVAGTLRYLDSTPGQHRAIARAVVLPAVGLPLSPAPYRLGEGTVQVRVRFYDRVLGGWQFADLSLRYRRGRWQISDGLAAMFTILG